MPAIASNVIVESEAFRANRIAHLELIAEVRGLERKVRDASARADDKFRSRGQLPPRERMNWLLDRDSPFLELSTLCGLGMHEDDGVDNVYGGGLIAGIGFVAGRALPRRGERFRDQGRRRASDGGREGDPRPGDRAPRKAALRPARRERRRQSSAPGRDVRARRRDLRQHGAHVGGGNSGDLDRARIVDRGRRLSDRPRRLCRDGARPLEGLSRRAAAAQGRDRRNRHGRGARRGGAALRSRRAWANILPRTTPTPCVSAGRSSPISAGAVRARALARRRRSTTPRNCSASCRSTTENPTTCARSSRGIVDGSDFLDFKPGYGPETVCGHAAIEGRPVGLIGNNGPIDSAGREQGRAVHPALLPGGAADRLPAEHHRLSGRRRGGDLGHHQARLQDDPGRHQRDRSETDAADRRLVRRRPLRHVRPVLRPAVRVLLAERARRGDGRRAGGQGDGDRRRGLRGRQGAAVRRSQDQGDGGDDRRRLRQAVDRALRHRSPLGRRADRSARQPGDARLLPRDLRGERRAGRCGPMRSASRGSDMALVRTRDDRPQPDPDPGGSSAAERAVGGDGRGDRAGARRSAARPRRAGRRRRRAACSAPAPT